MKKKLFVVMIVCCLLLTANTALSDNTHSADLESGSSQYLSITDAAQTGLKFGSGDFSFEAWVKFESIGQVGASILSKHDSTIPGDQYIFEYRSNGDKLYLAVSSNCAYSAGTYKQYFSNTSLGIITGVWYHFAVTFDNSVGLASFYVNGLAAGTHTISFNTAMANCSSPFRVGANAGGNGVRNYLDGLIDDIRVWDVLRTSTEISANYQNELTGNEPNLAGYWKFNGNAADATVNSNNLTNNNGAVFSSDVPVTSSPTASACSIQGDIIDIAGIADQNGNGYAESLALGLDSNNIPTVCVSDINTGTFIKEIQFFSAGWSPESVYVVPDISSPADGIDDISVMAVDTDTGQAKSQIMDTDLGVLIKEVVLP